MVSLHFLFSKLLTADLLPLSSVPVIAIATKFDDLIVQLFTRKKGLEKSRQEATKLWDDKLDTPLRNFKFPPRAYIRLEGTFFRWFL